jgi:hypothetical protein
MNFVKILIFCSQNLSFWDVLKVNYYIYFLFFIFLKLKHGYPTMSHFCHYQNTFLKILLQIPILPSLVYFSLQNALGRNSSKRVH